MEVIFIKDLKNQGKKGQVKTVKDGYAENFLIKKGYAVKKTKENMTKLNYEKKKKEQEEKDQQNKALELKDKMKDIILEFKVKTGEGDRVFGSISVKQITNALKEKGYMIDKNQVDITNTIQSLGFHNVNIILYPGVEVPIKIHVIK